MKEIVILLNPIIVHELVKVVDVVFIHDEGSRLFWKLGKVLSLNRGIDNIVRSVELLTKSGKMSHPVIKLYPLELGSEAHINTVSPAIEAS